MEKEKCFHLVMRFFKKIWQRRCVWLKGASISIDLYQISVEDWLYLGEGDSMPPTATPRFILAYPRDGADAEGFVIAEEADDAQ